MVGVTVALPKEKQMKYHCSSPPLIHQTLSKWGQDHFKTLFLWI